VLATGLRQVDGVPEHVFDVLGHGIEITFRGTDPLERLASLFRHRRNYANLGIVMSMRSLKCH
jgi:hypothetical protein